MLGETNLRERVKNIFDIYKNQASKKGIKLEIAVDERLDRDIKAPYREIFKILSNLLSNAIKFTEKGTVRIGCKELDNKRMEITVEDTGIGIDREKQKRLYEPFEQGEYFLNKKYGGTGLGLAIVKKLVDMLHGEIGAETEIGRGTKFTVILPFEEIEEAENGKEKRIRIISAEDVEINQKLLEKWLGDEGYGLTKVYNGQELLDSLEKNSYDLILMDVQMPVLNGINATKIIRQNLKYRDIPIIAVTAFAFEEEKEELFKVGMDEILTKPINKKRLIEMVEKYKSKPLKRDF
jgi:CheY-like chemotaxis protein/anti-sigma regulatory factor (Ser/Thr protein kinase)